MVHMYTRVNNFCDLLMRETPDQFEVELRNRDDIVTPFPPGRRVDFSKEKKNAEREAINTYNKVLAELTSE